jgi:hypothetical protein
MIEFELFYFQKEFTLLFEIFTGIQRFTSKNQKAAQYAVDTGITSTSSDGYRNVIGLPASRAKKIRLVA